MRVLILDDYPVFRIGLKQILAQMGTQLKEQIDIEESGDIKSAIDIIHGKKIDIVMVDILLKDENGFELSKLIKCMNKKTKIIYMSESNSHGEAYKAKELCANGFILKNSFAEDFFYAIRVVNRGENYFSMNSINNIIENKGLTKRENEVFSLLKEGKTNQEIGKELYISESTTKKHVSNILGKLGLKNRVEAALLFSGKI